MDKALLAALKPMKVESIKEGFDVILYGEPKSGKTTTLDDPNMRILLFDLEGGSSVLAGSSNVDIVKIVSLEQLNAYLELINENKWFDFNGKVVPLEHGLIALDSITRLTDYVKEFVVKILAPNRKREIQGTFGSQSDWGNFGTIISDLVKYVHTMTKRGERSINFMWLAHKDNKYEDPMVENKVTGTQIKMQGGSVPVVMSTVDAIFYMSKEVGKDKEVHYFIRTETAGITEAGVRQSRREEKLPKIIENPVWSDVFKQLGYRIEPPIQK